MLIRAEFSKLGQGALRRVIPMPFGLDLTQGLIMQPDVGALLTARRFDTCLSADCAALFALDTPMLQPLHEARLLKVSPWVF